MMHMMSKSVLPPQNDAENCRQDVSLSMVPIVSFRIPMRSAFLPVSLLVALKKDRS